MPTPACIAGYTYCEECDGCGGCARGLTESEAAQDFAQDPPCVHCDLVLECLSCTDSFVPAVDPSDEVVF